MKKFLVLIGLPGSGKSTEAQRLVDSGGYLRINRDTVREMLLCPRTDGKKAFDPKIEKMVTEITQDTAIILMENGKYNIVLDECNLNPQYLKAWEKIAKRGGYNFQKRTMDVSIDECIRRDALRTPNVGKRVIYNMALRNGMLDDKYNVSPPKNKILFPEKKFVLCDIDGTLANVEHRRCYVRDGNKDWNGFFEAMSKDTVRKDVLDILQAHVDCGFTPVLVTARPQDYLVDTVDWLYDNDIPFEWLIMRKAGDYRRDDIVKQEILDTYFNTEDIEVVIDDRPSVLRMWASNGLETIDVGDGIDF